MIQTTMQIVIMMGAIAVVKMLIHLGVHNVNVWILLFQAQHFNQPNKLQIHNLHQPLLFIQLLNQPSNHQIHNLQQHQLLDVIILIIKETIFAMMKTTTLIVIMMEATVAGIMSTRHFALNVSA